MKWQSKSTKPIKILAFTSGLEMTGRVKGASSNIHRPQTLFIAPTSRAGRKKTPGSRKKTLPHFAMAVTNISVRTLQSIISFRWLGWVKRALTALFWLLIYTASGIGRVRRSTGKPNSKKTSVWDKPITTRDLLIALILVAIWKLMVS